MTDMLVVIAIIAVLIAMLLPSLSKAQRSSQSLQCASNLRQLALAWQMYVNDYQGSMMWYGTLYNQSYGVPWQTLMNPYIAQGVDPYHLCPATLVNRPRPGTNPGTNAMAYLADQTTSGVTTLYDGSYCFNLGLVPDQINGPTPNTITASTGTNPASGTIKLIAWNKMSQLPRGGTQVPVFCDGVWRDTTPDNTVTPPTNFQFGGWPSSFLGVNRVCIDRHDHAVNVVFADCHVETDRLPVLWQMQWCRTTVPRYVASSFPPGYR